jgi:acid phosphatase class B
MNIIVVDIDGTIAKVSEERFAFLQQERKDWDKFYEMCFQDEPIQEIIDLVKMYYNYGYYVVFCTSRRESIREITNEWLKLHFSQDLLTKSKLLMRPDKDHSKDYVLKPRLLKQHNIPLEDIKIILEDRNEMVKKYREMGLRVLQVADGDF